jgi:hypothetical protein
MSGEQRARGMGHGVKGKGPRVGAVYTRIIDVVNDAVDCRHFYIGNRLTNYLEIMQTSVKEILDMIEDGSLRRAKSEERRAEGKRHGAA